MIWESTVSQLVLIKSNPSSNTMLIKRHFRIIFLLFITALLVSNIHAQESQDGNGGSESATNDGPTGPGGGPGDPDVPIDGGISLLIAAGIGYGLKKKRDDAKKAGSAEKDASI
jgi:hypothetical protein